MNCVLRPVTVVLEVDVLNVPERVTRTGFSCDEKRVAAELPDPLENTYFASRAKFLPDVTDTLNKNNL